MNEFTQFLDEILSDRSHCVSSDLLIDWVAGIISDEQREDVEKHIEQCRFCEDESKQLQTYRFEPAHINERKPNRWRDVLWIARPAVAQLAYRRDDSEPNDEQLFSLYPNGEWLVFNFSEDDTAVITLKLDVDSTGIRTLHGRVRGMKLTENTPVRCIWADSQTMIGAGQLDNRGRFTISPVQIGQCQLTIKVDEKMIVLPYLILNS